MLESFNSDCDKPLDFEKDTTLAQLQILQAIAQQAVLSVEAASRIPEGSKKEMALRFVEDLLEEMGIVASDGLVEIAIEVSMRVLKALPGLPSV